MQRNTTTFELRTPPAATKHVSGFWRERLEALSERHPGAWAVVALYKTPKSAGVTARQLRKRKDLPDGHWEFVARGPEVFARFSPNGLADDPPQYSDESPAEGGGA